MKFYIFENEKNVIIKIKSIFHNEKNIKKS